MTSSPAIPSFLTPAATACSHCALPVPRGLIDPESSTQFCCHGCRTAYDIIRACNLERYYHVRDQAASPSKPVRSTSKKYTEFDDPLFASLYIKTDTLSRVELYLEGVHCAACVWLVERLPHVVPGVIEARLDPRRALVAITWDRARVPLSRIARTLDSLGYAPHPAREATARSLRRLGDRRSLIRLAVAGACAGNVMLLALALYSGVFDSMEAQYQQLFRWMSMLISLISVAWPGGVFFRGALAALRTRTAHLDLPIAIGLGAGAIWGIVNTVRGTGEIYFDSLSVLVFALLVGRLIQHRQQRWSADAVELLFSLTPGSVRRIEEGAIVEIPIEALHEGDLVEVLAGDSIPADGSVESGDSSIDQSLLTGESVPVTVGPASPVSAGAVNLTGPIRVRVTATGEATRVGRLMKMVEEGTRRRAPIVRLADRIASWFVLAMLSLATATAIAWIFINPARAIDNAAALLIVTCPCALGLATPLAVTVAIGRAAKRGILIKGGDAVQVLSGRGGVMFLDKTGTLTQGKMTLISWHGPDVVKPLLASLESESTHPIARALARDLLLGWPAAPRRESAFLALARATHVHQLTGAGITGQINGSTLAAGSASYIRSIATTESPTIAAAEADCLDRALTPILIALDHHILAVAGVGDPLRDDAAASVQSLTNSGWDVRILSGDHPAIVAAAARTLNIQNATGGTTPEDKLAAITQAAKAARVVMVGDGVNDAAALAAATVGIAVHGGAEASLSAADIYLSRPGLSPIVDLARASRKTLSVIRLNLAASLFYNSLAASLAVTGLISPLIAAILMPVSSLTVLTLSFKARTFGRNGSGPCP